MYEVGRRWEKGAISVAQEHLATTLITGAISQAFFTLPQAPVTRGLAVVSATPNEFHQLGASMIASTLETDGWRVHFLGGDMPHSDLLTFLGEQKPFLLALSTTIPFNLTQVGELLAEIRSAPDLKQLKILVGGQAWAGDAGLALKLGADGFANDLRSALDLANRWWEAR